MQVLETKDRKISHSPVSWTYKKELKRSEIFKSSSMLTEPGYNTGKQETTADIQ